MIAGSGTVGAEVRADVPAGAAALLRSTTAVRTRAGALLERARDGRSRWWTVRDDAIAAAADEVATLTRARYPGLDVPYHSRWRHFEAGGVDRWAESAARCTAGDPRERARAMIDVAVVSVLLDAGAGPNWRYVEDRDGERTDYRRSEGLAVASWHGFVDGAFSGDPERPLQADSAGLRALTESRLAEVFQAGPDNPLVGLAGRAGLMRRLGDALAAHPEVFGADGRPGGLLDALAGNGATVDAHDILTTLLGTLSPIWPSANVIGGIPLGDCWRHDAVTGAGLSAGWMPLHKLSQWLTYSLIEPFAAGGVTVAGVERLTGLPEYRNGGLLVDSGVLVPVDDDLFRRSWTPADELVVEWRALTVALLDELGPLVCNRLGLDPLDTPLARVLEGGTWAAGRAAAQRLRGGMPPLSIVSDGTVF